MADFEITGEISGEADPQSLGRVKKAFSDAMIQALTSPQVRAAANRLAVTIGQSVAKAMKGVSKGTESEFRKMREQARAAAREMGKAFEEVGRKAREALTVPTRNASLGTLETSIASIAERMEALSTATREQIRLLEIMMRAQGTATRARSQEARDAVLSSTQAARQQIVDSQKQIAAARDAANIQVATIRATSREAIQRSRVMSRVFELTWKSAERAVRAFARGASSILRGLGRTVTSAFRGIGRTIERTFSSAQRGMSRFVQGITRGFAAVSRAIASAMRRDEQAITGSFRRREAAFNASLSRQQRAAQRFQTQRSAGLLGGLGGGGLLAGAAGGAGIFQLLTSGFERAGLQERLQLQFTALLGDGQQAAVVLQRLSDYARTTAFDFTEVAGSVAQLTAAFGDVDKAEQYVKLLSDLTAISGGTTAQLSAARLAFAQIAASGRLEAQELNQLTESLPGIPIVQILAERFFGGDVAAFQDARRAGTLGGKITSDAFFEALLSGAQERFPDLEGFAVTAAETLTGKLANLKENFAIFGATLIGLVEGPIKQFMGGLNEALALAGGFISGSIFGGGGGTAGAVNPWEQLANINPAAHVPFEDLTPEMQESLRLSSGWEEGQGFFLSAAHAAELWNKQNAEAAQTAPFGMTEENLARLKEFRDLLADMAKSVGLVLGVAGAFKLLRLALIALTSPLALVVGAAAGLGFIWNRLTENSVIFRNSVTGLFSRLRGLRDVFFELLGTIGKLISTAIFGNPDFWKNMGDSLAEFVGWLSRGVGHFTEWLQWVNNMLALGQVGAVFTDINKRIAEFLGGFLDITPEEIEAKGGGIAGLLRNTFLEPVVDFFTITLPENIGDITSAISGFFSDIWNAFTGGGSSGTGVLVADMGPNAPGGRDGGMGGFLAETFLNPILGFFRDLPGHVTEIAGHVADFWTGVWDAMFGGPSGAELTGSVITTAGGVGTAGGQFGMLTPLWNSLTNFKNNVQTLGLGEAFGEIWDGIVESAGNIWTNLKPKLDELWENVKGFFSGLDWGTAILGAGAGTIAGAAIGGLPGAAIGGLGGLLLGGGTELFQPLADTISGAWSETIFPALTDLWHRITSWFADIFTYDNLKGAGLDIFNMMGRIGEEIGAFFGSNEFQVAVGAVAGIAAGITALVANFTRGLAVGLSGAFLDWSNLFADFLEDAWNAVGDRILFAPEMVTDAIGTALGSATGGAVALAGLVVIGPAIVKAIIGGITTFGPRLIAGGGGLFALLTGSKSPKQIGQQFSRNPALKSVGAGIAAGIAGGIGAYLLGQAAGEEGGAGNIILSLLAGGGAGAALGMTFGPLGAAIGGALGVAAAGVGAFFGNASREARETQEAVDALADSLRGLSGAELTQSIEGQLRDALLGAATGDAMRDWGQLMLDNFDFQGFATDLTAGLGQADLELVGLVENIQDQLATQLAERGGLPPEVANDIMGQLVEQMRIAAETGDPFTSVVDLVTKAFSQLPAEVRAALGPTDLLSVILGSLGEGADVTVGDLQNILDVATQTGDKLRSAFEQIDTEDAVTGIDSVSEAVTRINDELGRGRTAQYIADVLGQSELTSAQALEAVADAASEARDALSDAQDALVEFITGGTDQPPSEEVILARFTMDSAAFEQDAAQVAQDVTDGVSQAMTDAATTLNFEDFKSSLNEAVRSAVEAGLITDPASFEGFQQQLIDQVNATVSDPDVANDMIAAINNLQLPDAQLFDNLRIAQMTQAKVDEIADIVRRGLEQALGQISQSELTASVITTAGGAGTAGVQGFDLGGDEAGVSFIADAVAAITGNVGDVRTVVETDVAGAVEDGVTNSKPAIEASGRKVTEGLATGIVNASGSAVGAARLVGAIVTIQLVSLASQMYNIGVAAGQGFANGVRSQVAAAAAAAAAIAQAATNAARRTLKSSSPSRVFHNIGEDVGKGFIRGIKASEGDMAAAIGDAISQAIAAGVKRAGVAVQRAQAAGEIFRLLAPSILPAGTTDAERLQDRLGVLASIRGFRGDLQSGAAGALGDTGNVALADALAQVRNLGRGVTASIIDVTNAFKEAGAQRQSIIDYDRRLRDINAAFRSGALGQAEYNRRVAEMREQVATGAMSAESFNDQLKILKREFSLGILNREAFEAAMSDLGSRPSALSYEQVQLLRTGPTTVDPRFAQGLENRELIMSSLQTIRDWGQEALNSGQSLAQVIPQMERYRDSLTKQLENLGFNAASIRSLVEQAGLSDKALQQLRVTLTSLDIATVSGAQNVANFLDQFVSIREFGQRMLEAGVGAGSVVNQMKAFRDAIVNQAVAFGFSRAQILELVKTIGLSDTQLAAFIKQFNNFNSTAKDAAKTAAEAAAAASAREKAEREREKAEREKEAREARERALEESRSVINRPTIERLIVNTPYGDSEAVALAAWNRFTYGVLSPT